MLCYVIIVKSVWKIRLGTKELINVCTQQVICHQFLGSVTSLDMTHGHFIGYIWSTENVCNGWTFKY